jgi:arylsulfatase
VIKPNTLTSQLGHVIDIAPTLLDILNIQYPDSVNGYPSLKLQGSSLLPVFTGNQRKEPEYFISGLDKFRMFRKGDFKIVRLNGGDWELYDIKNDPAELKNLASTLPAKVEELSDEYEKIEPGLFK